MVIRSSSDNTIHVKKEEGITDNGNRNTHDGHNCRDNGTSRTHIRDGFRIQQNVQEQIKKEEEEDQKHANTTNLDDFSDWKKGNWCWMLSPHRVQRRRNSNITHTTVKSEGSNNNNNNDVSQTEDRKIMSTSPQSNNDNNEENGNGNDNDDDNDDDDYDDNGGSDKVCNQSNYNNNKRKESSADSGGVSMKKKIRLVPQYSASAASGSRSASASTSTLTSLLSSDCRSNGDDDKGYESWTEGSWCWLVTSSSSSSRRNNGVAAFPVSKQMKTGQRQNDDVRRKQQHHSFHSGNENDNDDDNRTEEDLEYMKDSNESDDDDQDEDEIIGKEEDEDNDDDDDDDDDDYDDNSNEMEGNIVCKTISNSKNNGDGIEDKECNDDVGYESWNEGNWPDNKNTPTPTPATTKSKTTRTIRVRVRCRHTRKMKNTRKGIHTQAQNGQWNKMFRRLVAYKEQHQTTNVPNKCKEDPQLGEWVSKQRTAFKGELIPTYRMDLLNSIGFVWDPCDAKWMEMYQRLVVYKKQHNNTSVPQHYKEDPKLARWVDTQRQYYKKKELSVVRISYLESIGFVWKIIDRVPWIEMYERIVAYKQRNGSTLVPSKYTEDLRLGIWVSAQRSSYNKGKLSEKRKELLNSINFVWWTRK